MSKKKSNNIVAVDLFCGVGGLTQGLQKAGIKVVAGIDNDESCKYAYEKNNLAQFIKADISKYPANEIKKFFRGAKIKILVGCAPCQTFSPQARKYRKYKDLTQDSRWTLLNFFAGYVNVLQPDIVSMENVAELEKFDIFRNFVATLKSLNYNVSYTIINCADYGLPQNRRRLVLLASKLAPIKLIPKANKYIKKYRTVKDAIGDLPAINNGEVLSTDPLHRSSRLTPINLKRIKCSKPGGTWRDWPIDLLPNCYKRNTGKSFTSVYGRMKWDAPSPTITTQFLSIGTGRFGHPDQDRALSLREGALLQTFPKKYEFFKRGDKVSLRTISRHIGNAVPVDLGKIIGISINEHLKKVEKNAKVKGQ